LNYEGKSVLVTGAGGFIGSHLTERVVALGARVRAFVHYNALGRSGWLDHSAVREQIQVVAGDICDRDCVREAMQGTELVFHLAALIGIPYSYHAPLSYLRTNIEGTLNVLQAARERDVERVIHTSTSETYGTAQRVPIDETHPLHGQSPYAASKIGADKMAEAFHLSFGLPVVLVRPFNTFGPRQSARAVIPSIITQCLAGRAVKLGNLAPTRDFTYVTDTVEGFVAAGLAPKALGRVINLGSGREISIRELVDRIALLTGRSVQVSSDDARVRPRGSEVERLVADIGAARELLGFEPKIGLDEGLRRTIDWLNEHQTGYRHDAYAI